ncbi:hypothetical protein ACLOJK_028527, partial [Asimina triloba]
NDGMINASLVGRRRGAALACHAAVDLPPTCRHAAKGSSSRCRRERQRGRVASSTEVGEQDAREVSDGVCRWLWHPVLAVSGLARPRGHDERRGSGQWSAAGVVDRGGWSSSMRQARRCRYGR